MRLLALPALLAVTTLCAQRQTWVVGPGGFANLQLAFDSPLVARGDIVLVRPGTYVGAVLRKGLVVRADPGAVLSGLTFLPPERLRIEAVAAPEQVVIAGFQLDSGYISVADCTGLVVLENLDAVQPANPNTYYPSLAVEVARCAWVSLTRLQARGRSVSLADSNVLVDQCHIESLDGYSGLGFRPSGGPGIGVQRCSLAVSATYVRGASWLAGSAACGSPALAVADSYVGLTGDVSLLGGSARTPCTTPGIAWTGAGSLVVDPATRIMAASNQVPPIIGVTPTVRPVPSLTAADFRLGTTASGAVVGQPGALYAVLIGIAAPPRFVAALNGGLGLDPLGPMVPISSGTLGATGTAPWSLPLPSLPALAGEVLGVQAIAGVSTVVLTNPLVRPLR